MNSGKFKIGSAYYRIGVASDEAATWTTETLVVIETFVYQGYFHLDRNSASCDIPGYFYVFQPFIGFADVLTYPPDEGLKVPSLQQADIGMSTLEELIAILNEDFS